MADFEVTMPHVEARPNPSEVVASPKVEARVTTLAETTLHEVEATPTADAVEPKAAAEQTPVSHESVDHKDTTTGRPQRTRRPPQRYGEYD